MIILAELVFYCSPVVLSHGTSSHVMPARAGATAGIYGCGQSLLSFLLWKPDIAYRGVVGLSIHRTQVISHYRKEHSKLKNSTKST